MVPNQSCQQASPQAQKAHIFDIAEAVERGELSLSISNMLGCDYIFVSHKGNHTLLGSSNLTTTIRELLDILEASPNQSMIISADASIASELSFTRYDYTWENRQISNVIATRVSHTEQIDFMQMMFDCSTPC